MIRDTFVIIRTSYVSITIDHYKRRNKTKYSMYAGMNARTNINMLYAKMRGCMNTNAKYEQIRTTKTKIYKHMVRHILNNLACFVNA